MTASSNRDPSASIGWHKTYPAIEANLLRGASARQVALWLRLRHVFWLDQCRPLSQQKVDRECRLMAAIDPADVVTETDLQQLLTEEFGFKPTQDGGWTIPELQEQYSQATEAYQRRRENGAKGGKRSAQVRQQGGKTEPGSVAEADDPKAAGDF